MILYDNLSSYILRYIDKFLEIYYSSVIYSEVFIIY
jgi:hypothetical protein